VHDIGTVIAANRTLGGLCDWIEATAPKPVDLPVEGGEALKAAIIDITLIYTTADPLGYRWDSAGLAPELRQQLLLAE